MDVSEEVDEVCLTLWGVGEVDLSRVKFFVDFEHFLVLDEVFQLFGTAELLRSACFVHIW